MKLSRRFFRPMPMTLALSVLAAGGCATGGQYNSGRLPYNASSRSAASENPFNTAAAGERAGQSQRPRRRVANASQQPPPMTPTTWNQPGGSPPATGRPVASAPAGGTTTSQAPADGPPVRGATTPQSPASSAPHQTAYYEQPTAGAAAGGASTGGAGTIQQMGYSQGAASQDPFADVNGQPASGGAVPAQYTVPPAGPRATAMPAGSGGTSQGESIPYEWAAPSSSSGGEEFMPPIQQ